MTKAPINLQDLRRRIYRKAKSDKSHRFWGLFVHVAKMETVDEAYRAAKRNAGAPSIDGQTFVDIEQAGRTVFLEAIREDLITGRYKPMPNRRVDIPKSNGKIKRAGNGYFLQMTPKKARKSIKATVRDIIQHSGATPMPQVVKQINASLTGWVSYFRVGNASRAFGEVRDYVEMKVRTLLTRRTRRRKTSVGWWRWSNEYLYCALGLYWDWKVQPLPGVKSFS